MSTKTPFIKSSKQLQNVLSLEEIAHLWNNSGQGRLASFTTVKRWLNNGPKTKNPRFEPWIIGQVRKLDAVKKRASTIDQQIHHLQLAVEVGKCGSQQQTATAAGLVAFCKTGGSMSQRQRSMLDSICSNISR